MSIVQVASTENEMPLSNKPNPKASALEKQQAYMAASSPILLQNSTIDHLKELSYEMPELRALIMRQ